MSTHSRLLNKIHNYVIFEAFHLNVVLGSPKHNTSNNNNRRPVEEDPHSSSKNTVIVFPIDGVITEPIGLLPEDKVIDLSVPVKTDSGVFEASSEIAKDAILDPSVVPNGGDIKAYSGYADEGSIGKFEGFPVDFFLVSDNIRKHIRQLGSHIRSRQQPLGGQQFRTGKRGSERQFIRYGVSKCFGKGYT